MVKLFRHYMPNHAPIWTQLGVAALGDPTMRIEIRVYCNCSVIVSTAQNWSSKMSKKLIDPKELFDSSVSGYSQGVIDTETGLLFISGQVDWNQQYEVVEKSVEGQTRRALNNLKIVLGECWLVSRSAIAYSRLRSWRTRRIHEYHYPYFF